MRGWDGLRGTVEYFCFPARHDPFGGPFNGQPARQALFARLVEAVRPRAIIETGTHVGSTTAHLALTGLPVFSIEASARRYGFARARLRRYRNVTLIHADSRAALRAVFSGACRGHAGGTLFAYLDAHWNQDLPLAEELALVFSNCPGAVVMVDDFQVPEDAGYGHDNYGPGKALTAEYVAPAMVRLGLRAFHPSTPSAREGGCRRGCIVLATASMHGPTLASVPLLRAA